MSAPAGAASRRGTGRQSLREELRQPLFRNGHALVLSSFFTASIGFAYWVLAARGYPPTVVGRNSVALTTMSFIGGIAQCNLASALWRFIPDSGRGLRRFVVGCYGFSIAVSIAMAALFFVVLASVAPSLKFLSSDHTLVVWFVVSTAAQAIFVLEDGVLTGLRRTPLVPIENAFFSLLKGVLVIAIAAIRPETGIFLSWTIATIATIVPTNVYIFTRAIPAHTREHPGGAVRLADLVRYVPYDYGAWLFWAASTTLLPLVVIAETGAMAEATFNFAWVITYSLYLVSVNLGSSLVVESASDQSDLHAKTKQVIVHLAKLLVPASLFVALGAPLIMDIFGKRYSSAGALTLRLLALSAPPFILTSTLQSALRAQRRTRPVLAIDATLCTIAVGISCALLPRIGIVATGIGWCAGQYLVAGTLCAVLAMRRRRDQRAAIEVNRLAAAARPGAPAALVAGGAEETGRAGRPPRVGGAGRAGRSAGAGLARDLLEELRPEIVAELVSLWPGPFDAEPSSVQLLPAATGAEAPLGGGAMLSAALHVNGWQVGLVQVARDGAAAAGLAEEAHALATLAADGRLGSWRELLPRGVTASKGGRRFSVQLLSGGTDADALLAGAPFLWRAVARRGLDVLGDLHARTAVSAALPARGGVTAEPLAHQVVATCERIRGQLAAAPRGMADARAGLARVEARLLAVASDAEGEPRSTVHGQLSPALLRLTPEAGLVTGLRGFARSRPDGVAALDSLGFLLRLSATLRRRSLADLVGEIARGGTLSTELSGLLPLAIGESHIGLVDLALWCWADSAAAGIEAPEALAAQLQREAYPVLASLERAS